MSMGKAPLQVERIRIPCRGLKPASNDKRQRHLRIYILRAARIGKHIRLKRGSFSGLGRHFGKRFPIRRWTQVWHGRLSATSVGGSRGGKSVRTVVLASSETMSSLTGDARFARGIDLPGNSIKVCTNFHFRKKGKDDEHENEWPDDQGRAVGDECRRACECRLRFN